MKRFLLVLALPLLAISSAYSQGPTMTINVFFHNERLNPEMVDCNKAFPTTRTIPKTTSVATAALRELFKGATVEEKEKGFWSFDPSSTSGILKSVRVKNRAAYLNFTIAVYEKLGNATTSCGSGFWPMVEKTLTQFPSIKKVYYAIDGDANAFYEWVQVGKCPYGKKICDSRNFR